MIPRTDERMSGDLGSLLLSKCFEAEAKRVEAEAKCAKAEAKIAELEALLRELRAELDAAKATKSQVHAVKTQVPAVKPPGGSSAFKPLVPAACAGGGSASAVVDVPSWADEVEARKESKPLGEDPWVTVAAKPPRVPENTTKDCVIRKPVDGIQTEDEKLQYVGCHHECVPVCSECGDNPRYFTTRPSASRQGMMVFYIIPSKTKCSACHQAFLKEKFGPDYLTPAELAERKSVGGAAHVPGAHMIRDFLPKSLAATSAPADE